MVMYGVWNRKSYRCADTNKRIHFLHCADNISFMDSVYEHDYMFLLKKKYLQEAKEPIFYASGQLLMCLSI